MLGQEHSRTFSPDMLSDRTLYNHFFAKEIERLRYSPYSNLDDMKITEVSVAGVIKRAMTDVPDPRDR